MSTTRTTGSALSSSATRQALALFEQRGGSNYGGEAVTQLEHGLQAAAMAEAEGATEELIVAALLHDVGHLLHDLPEDAPEQGLDDLHEDIGANWLRGWAPDEVLEPVRLHVASKRYLCATEPGYYEALSEPSKVSLELQGGPMTPEECDGFRDGPHFEAAIRLRRWDDEAKVAGLETPTIEHYATLIDRVATRADG